MKTTTVVCLLSLSVFAAERRPVLAVFPPAAVDPGGKELALLIQARTSAVLATTERYSDIHLKQILAMASREGLDIEGLEPKNSERAAKLLGAERLTWGQLEREVPGACHRGVHRHLRKEGRRELYCRRGAPHRVGAGLYGDLQCSMSARIAGKSCASASSRTTSMWSSSTK